MLILEVWIFWFFSRKLGEKSAFCLGTWCGPFSTNLRDNRILMQRRTIPMYSHTNYPRKSGGSDRSRNATICSKKWNIERSSIQALSDIPSCTAMINIWSILKSTKNLGRGASSTDFQREEPSLMTISGDPLVYNQAVPNKCYTGILLTLIGVSEGNNRHDFFTTFFEPK
jgi:hypothetical protein